jgi:alpha-glucosidase
MWYLHNYAPEQPDLNWWNQEVRDEFERILRFWFDRGIAGFRIDVASGLVKDRLLRDNPPAKPGDPPKLLRFGQRRIYNRDRPEVHDVYKRWRQIAQEYDPPVC